MNKELSARAEREREDMICHRGQLQSGSACGAHRADMASRHLRRRGVVLVWSALMLFLMIGFIGLSIDWAKLLYNVHQMQNAADSAALAGAQVVKGKSADVTRQQTHDLGFANAAEGLAVTLRMTEQPDPFPYPTDWDDPAQVAAYEAAMAPLDIVVRRWVTYNHTFVPTLDAPNAVMAITRRAEGLDAAPALAMIFGPIFGVDTADASRLAVAFNANSGGAGLIVLSSDPTQTLDLGGGPTIDLDGGGIHVNSFSDDPRNNWAGAAVGTNTRLDAGFLNVVGTVNPPPEDSDWGVIFDLAAEELDAPGGFPVMDYSDNIQPIDDPLAAGMLADPEAQPYVVPFSAEGTQTGPGARLNLPALLDTEGGAIPTRLARWNSSSSGYDLISPADPSVKMQWNGLSYDQVSADLTFDHPSLFRDTVGMVSEIVTDPNTGLLVLDPTTGLPTYSTGNGNVTVTLPPGYYPNGMRLTTGDNVTLAQSSQSGPGTFFIWGGGAGGTAAGMYMSAGSLTGHGVTCYVTENFDTHVPGVIRITGGYLDIDSPGDWTNQNSPTIDMSLVEGLNGISIWQDPAMNPLPDAHLNGNGDFHISGTIYLPDPIHMRLEGDLGDTGNQILCGSAVITGTAALHVNYDGRNYGLSVPRSYLVW